MSAPGEPIRVVAGVLIERGRVMVARRTPGQSFAGCWEFPGGKVDPGESPEEALVRELHEEVGITVAVGIRYDRAQAEHGSGRVLEITFYLVRRESGEPQPIEVAEVAWWGPEQLRTGPVTPGDRRVVDRVAWELETGALG